jgi:hypothetical protein
MKTKEIAKACNPLLFCLFICVTSNALGNDTPTTIKTPKNSTVPDTYLMDEVSQSEIDAMNDWATSTYPNAILIESATRTYNCHAYAWHVSEGGNKVWIGCYTATAEDIYWQDGSYGEVTTEAAATKVSYASDNHSAVTTNQSGWFISKWGATPLMKHAWNDCPYNDSQLKYYAITINVIYPPSAPAVNNNFVVAVKNWKGSTMIPDANVTLLNNNQTIDTKTTANVYPDKGTAKFSYNLTPGTMIISVAKEKYFPFEGTCELVARTGELWISLHGGMTKPYDDWYENTYCFNSIVNFEYHFITRWALVLELAYNDFKWLGTREHFPWWNISPTIRYYFQIKRLKPFINLGPGFYIPHEGDNRIGAKLGLGLDYPISNRINIEIGTDYHYLLEGNVESLNQDRKTSFQHFHTGIIYKLRQNK